MRAKEIRKIFLKFFENQGHKIVASSSLVPQNDPTVLLTTAGMQQFKPHFLGERDPLKDFGSKRTASCQKCFRTPDIDSVGDETHLTFFEMLGNFSLGDYFKKGAIEFALDLLENHYGFKKERFWITVFEGDEDAPKDEEAIGLWVKNGIPRERIFEFGKQDNFWGPPGKTGPCGPCSEIHYDLTQKPCGENCWPNCDCGRFLEIWNLVFMQYFKDEKGQYQKLPAPSIDTGLGLERLALILQKKKNIFETDLFESILKITHSERSFRIILDHLRGSTFLIADGVEPSNVERGYILRRILRRAIRHAKLLNLERNFYVPIIQKVINLYQDFYPELRDKEEEILTVVQREEEKFSATLEKGLREFEKIAQKSQQNQIRGREAFWLYETYGFPLELTEELAREKELSVDKKGFEEEFLRHQEISRAGVESKFGGVGKEATLEATRLHTATHLLHSVLRAVLGEDVKQMGSDITPQRLRFDFTHPQKMSEEEIKKVEDLVNQKIKEDLEVKMEEMDYQEAIQSGALAFFKEKYPERVTVYSIGNFSKEICAGPHVSRTSELGQFKIIKEESSGSGTRRIRAILE